MREILFRGKRIDNGEWVEGFILKECNYVTCSWNLGIEYKTDRFGRFAYEVAEIIPKTVGQYTGLTDKNGTKIFEGDVFKFPDEIFESYYTSCGTEYDSWETENYGVIGFDEDSGRYDFVQYRFNNNVVDADLHENKDIDFADFVRELEVIGNIHDNPELINPQPDSEEIDFDYAAEDD